MLDFSKTNRNTTRAEFKCSVAKPTQIGGDLLSPVLQATVFATEHSGIGMVDWLIEFEKKEI